MHTGQERWVLRYILYSSTGKESGAWAYNNLRPTTSCSTKIGIAFLLTYVKEILHELPPLKSTRSKYWCDAVHTCAPKSALVGQAISAVSKVVRKRDLARWIYPGPKWFGCQKPVGVRTLGSNGGGPNRAVPVEHARLVP